MSNPVSSLAPAIAGYIAAANARDSSAVTRFFAEDANVFDEGQHRVGTQAIAQWMEDTAQRFQPRVEVLNVQQRTGKVLVHNLISGTFPGSPLELRYTFRLDEQGKISRLDISI
ncbi:nuclear transport factor 2 family protein [Pseudomonas thivervalensis]|jgi:ketosteroid isomerase-like protein|uniref:Nuclear transport factor 2 family protein n=1 Tax=Pseudomonas thivervalensis TaxID=86265 RepID=A0A176NEZ2_9PSED|nr:MULTISPECIES: nuclear transport factor 2 family protein [Pseudomonas]AXA54033.1 nuclear transport factor 2 family protein [Pseudomonas thivervalensis]AXA59718.1 nuclear transport factor 2 family protein [Pseudomonas thivervalensis]MBO1541149.1 nuclear transport factor 2 family protein [Pseudomonas sp. OA65]OAB49702.1 ketosteroid isomerase [Pseudomonas thivervalensis]SDF64104.1 Ketosteroid isomerase homolog [Pseudomonas thivervalensis]